MTYYVELAAKIYKLEVSSYQTDEQFVTAVQIEWVSARTPK